MVTQRHTSITAMLATMHAKFLVGLSTTAKVTTSRMVFNHPQQEASKWSVIPG